jgi:hypothetical protein
MVAASVSSKAICSGLDAIVGSVQVPGQGQLVGTNQGKGFIFFWIFFWIKFLVFLVRRCSAWPPAATGAPRARVSWHCRWPFGRVRRSFLSSFWRVPRFFSSRVFEKAPPGPANIGGGLLV